MTERVRNFYIDGHEITLKETSDGFRTSLTDLEGQHYQTTRYVYPKRAHIYLHEDEEIVEGKKVVMNLIRIFPPVRYEVYRFDQSPIVTIMSNLFGEKHVIKTDGSLQPKNIFESLQLAKELDYDIDQKVLEALRVDDSAIVSVFGEMLD